MDSLSHADPLRGQYATAEKLGLRISLHEKYSTNPQGFLPWVASHCAIAPGMRVLELGCGTGRIWADRAALIDSCSRFVLSDLSEGMLRQARETLRGIGGIEYRAVDIQSIPFPAHSFDVVIANMMLYHVPDLPRALCEVRRVLSPDGAFYCATYGENGMMRAITALFRDFAPEERVGGSFTLQNGAAALAPFFEDVQLLRYEDSLAVTDAGDLADYILSLPGYPALRSLPRETLLSVLEANMKNGVLVLPKEYGMFCARAERSKS